MTMHEDGQDAVRVTDAAQNFVNQNHPGSDGPDDADGSNEPRAGASEPSEDASTPAGENADGEATTGRGGRGGAGGGRSRTRGGRGRKGAKDKPPVEDVVETTDEAKDEIEDDAPVAAPSKPVGRGRGSARGEPKAAAAGSAKTPAAKEELVINYVPGEECRVAVLRDGRLEEFHAERVESASHVGNIYVGKVANVEPQIQAAFIDFGLEHNGFLHISDLHPRYFPGEDGEATERVGKKTPRRDRPPIQECLRRGQEVAVQVLKEGVGTKGPTVTSYLSVPGRFLVMMPQMDKVGVSRKVEDEETRRKMRDILDQLELPEGFGFIVRTAGMDRNKTELKRDLAYLQRLWKDIEKRWKTNTGRPRLLYSESDLLVRTLRDILTTDMHRVVVDNELALQRASRFLKIVSPRSTTSLVHYTGKTPIYHALGVEEQIQRIHAREVPLQSGGRLVIDETEALVAIDVNSGKSRDARDAETNAFRTNLEAADEICRQLRLRDLGGIVINDLIDMRSLKHRREVEGRFRENLKRDRARSSIETISQFGILEMTRQRMRGSHESIHFSGCQTCRGRGLVQRPDSVASDALRDMAAILDHERVARVEMVVNPRIAGELLSGKRRALSRLEKTLGKRVDVRVSEAVPIDRVTFYAYDERGADVDISKLTVRRATSDQLVTMDFTAGGDNWADDVEHAPSDEQNYAEETAETEDVHPIELDEDDAEVSPEGWGSVPEADRRTGGGRGRGGRGERADRGERGGRGGGRDDRQRNDRGGGGGSGGRGNPRGAPAAQAPQPPREVVAVEPVADHEGPGGEPGEGEGEGGRRRRRRRRRGGRGRSRGHDGEVVTNGESGDGPHTGEAGGYDSESSDVGDTDETESEGHDDHADHDEDTGGGNEQGHESGGEYENAEGGEAGEGGENGEGGRKRRRRRRRGGRGRGRGQDGEMGADGGRAPGSEAAPAPAPQAREPREPRGEPRHDRADNGRRGGPAPRHDQPRVEPKPKPEPRTGGSGKAPEASKPPAKPAPRSLYGSRRKLGPGERRPSGGREE